MAAKSLFFKTTTVPQAEIEYEVIPNCLPQTTVFVHGNLASGRWWYPTEEAAKRHYKGQALSGDMILVNFRGCGKSSAPKDVNEVNMRLFAEDFNQLVQSLQKKSEKINLVGHSTGGLAVLGISALHPDRIFKTVSIAPVVYGPVVGLFKTAVLLHRVRLGAVFELGFHATQLSENFLEQGFLRGVQNPNKFKNLPGIHTYIKNYFPAFKQLSAKNMNMILDMLDRTDLRPMMTKYTTPTLLVRSLVDPIVPSFSSDHLAKDHSSIKEVLFNNCGHFVHLEEQEEFEKVVLKFLS